MITAETLACLQKYFGLARSRFACDDFALATFFAATAIEESAKLLILEGGYVVQKLQKERRRDALTHKQKYFSAVINLFHQWEEFESLPKAWQNEVWAWCGRGGLASIRNKSLYLYVDEAGHLHSPDRAASRDRAALIVYMSGIALARLEDYLPDIPDAWARDADIAAEAFRESFLGR